MKTPDKTNFKKGILEKNDVIDMKDLKRFYLYLFLKEGNQILLRPSIQQPNNINVELQHSVIGYAFVFFYIF